MTMRYGVLLPGYISVGTGINDPVRGVVQTRQGPITAICKKLPRKSLLVEILCACLGRKLGLPIPVPVLAIHAESREPWFGSEDAEHPSLRQWLTSTENEVVQKRLLRWKDYAGAAGFDVWIANHDRHSGNLLYDGGTGFWLIDHDQAMQTAPPTEKSGKLHLIDIAALQNETFKKRFNRDFQARIPAWTASVLNEASESIAGYEEFSDLLAYLEVRRTLIADIVSRRFGGNHHDLFH